MIYRLITLQYNLIYVVKFRSREQSKISALQRQSGSQSQCQFDAIFLNFHIQYYVFIGFIFCRSIVLKACFNISRTDSKCKYSIALHTHNECVRIALSSEEEMNDWLRIMNSLSGEEDDQVDNLPQNSIGRPHFEHIWLVTALNKGLGSKENIIGPYRLCLTSKEVTLLKVGEHDGRNGVVKFPVSV